MKLKIAFLQLLPGKGLEEQLEIGKRACIEVRSGGADIALFLEVGDSFFIVDEENALQIFRVYAVGKIAEDDIAGFEKIAREGNDSLILITCEGERPEGGYANRRVVAAEPYSGRLQF